MILVALLVSLAVSAALAWVNWRDGYGDIARGVGVVCLLIAAAAVWAAIVFVKESQ